MLTDDEIQKLSDGLIEIYYAIELEMLRDVANRFDTYETLGGTQEWRLKKLDELGALNASSLKIMKKYSSKTTEELKKALQEAMLGNFDKEHIDNAYKDGLLEMNVDGLKKSKHWQRIFKYSYKDVKKNLKLINTKAVESQKKAYIDVLNRAYVETSTGVKSYNEAIHDALVKYAEEGITGATYKRKRADGSTYTVQYSLEGTVRRDVVTAINSTANRASVEMAKEAGYTHVEVSQHLGARVGKTKWSNHAGWQGKVYAIDDLEEETGYGHIEGLGGVNCRHRTFPFIVGVDKPKQHIDEAENERVYKAEQGQRKLEREMRDLRKQWEVVSKVGTKQEKKALKDKIAKKNDEIDEWVKSHEGLKRQFNKETVSYSNTTNVDIPKMDTLGKDIDNAKAKIEAGEFTDRDSITGLFRKNYYVGTNPKTDSDVFIRDKDLSYIINKHVMNGEVSYEELKNIDKCLEYDVLAKNGTPDGFRFYKKSETRKGYYEMAIKKAGEEEIIHFQYMEPKYFNKKTNKLREEKLILDNREKRV